MLRKTWISFEKAVFNLLLYQEQWASAEVLRHFVDTFVESRKGLGKLTRLKTLVLLPLVGLGRGFLRLMTRSQF